jgi:DNA mismatch repair ATPase MutS
VHYFAGDMENIASYYDYRRDNGLDDFLLDETTWYDLEMDDIFRRLNPGLTTSGEQYLYYMLRSPAVTKAEYERRRTLISQMQDNPALRLKLQDILDRLGRSRNAVMGQAFNPEYHGYGRLLLYVGLMLLFIASVIAAFIIQKAVLIALVVLAVNMAVHSKRLNTIRRDFDTVNYSLAMIVALKRIRKLRDPIIDTLNSAVYGSLDRFRSAVRLGGVSGYSSSEVTNSISTVLLLDLISYEFLKNKLWRNRDDLFTIHESLGRIDAAIAVASYIKGTPYLCQPDIDFSGGGPSLFEAAGMVHPMIKNPVSNGLAASNPILITGSNASGKSTYIKTTALCAILAQAICAAPAQSYRATAFRIYSSMAVTDDLSAGESYYIVEIKSLKRIFDAAASGGRILCFIDEVLRGTNTVERIAASTEVLAALHGKGVLCVAATHDIELCSLLAGRYALYHFEETLGADDMVFDYKIKPGPAGTRNAINLLKLMGFDGDIVKRAHERANRYMENGVWTLG